MLIPHFHFADTFGMMSLSVDSYEEDTVSVYCAFTVTAHDYSGAKIRNETGNGTILHEADSIEVDGGESGGCTFYVNYTDYASFVEVDDPSEIPYFFKMTLSATV